MPEYAHRSRFGVPAAWPNVWVRYGRGADEPMAEAEATYLERHDLLSSAEAAKLVAPAFDPVALPRPMGLGIGGG